MHLKAVNNQHSHLEEELVRMQGQLLVLSPAEVATALKARHGHAAVPHHHQHVYRDTNQHPYQPQPQHFVHHEGHGAKHHADVPDQHTLVQQDMAADGRSTTSADDGSMVQALANNAVALPQTHGAISLTRIPAEAALTHAAAATALPTLHHASSAPTHIAQPSDGHPGPDATAPTAMVAGRPCTSIPKSSAPIIRARVTNYSHPSILARMVVSVLLRGDKLLLDLPDEPDAVSSLLTALGHAAVKLQHMHGLATALDPVYDAACGPAPNGHNGANGQPGHHHNGSPATSSVDGGSGSGNGNGGGSRRHEALFTFCCRAIPMPPAAGGHVSPASPASPPAAYTVGQQMGQQLLRVGPQADAHVLLPPLLHAILRDGIVTVRCNWYDEELSSGSWSDDEEPCEASSPPPSFAGGLEGAGVQGSGAGAGLEARQGVVQQQYQQQQQGGLGGAGGSCGSLVTVPGVLRAIFKLDRQLRGLDLGGLVVLPHTFVRSGDGINSPTLFLDIVIA